MTNPLLNKKHIKEYISFGLLASICYTFFVFLFLEKSDYNYLYYLYVGNAAFMFMIGIYHLILIRRPYDGKRAMSMLLAGHAALFTGILFSLILIVCCVLIYFPDLSAYYNKDQIITNTPSSVQINRPSGLIFVLAINAIIVNVGAGSLLSIMFAYAGKRNQTKDKPADLENKVPASSVIPDAMSTPTPSN